MYKIETLSKCYIKKIFDQELNDHKKLQRKKQILRNDLAKEGGLVSDQYRLSLPQQRRKHTMSLTLAQKGP